jgi:hypothetical protein
MSPWGSVQIRNRLLARLPLGDYALLEPRVGCASARGHLGKQVITDDGRRDAACTASWCIGAAQRWLGNDRAARSASLRHGAVRVCSIYIYCTAEWIISNEWHERLIGYAFTKYAQVRDADESSASRTAATW